MGILNIQDARREGARLLIFLAGVSGVGKTYTALQLAYGLENGDGRKVGFLDTEAGRGRLYADEMPGTYLYAELMPPYSPARYVQAIKEFADAGVGTLVIDSGSHEFEGEGGIQEIAEAGNPRLPNWNKAKGEHKKFMSALLASPMHIIRCCRARAKAKPEKQIVDGREKTVYVDMGLQPITEKNVMFEATVSLMLHDQGRRQDVVKCPAALANIMGRGHGYLTMDDGRAMRAWVDGAKQLDPGVEHSKGLLKLAAESGLAALQEQWQALSAPHRKAIGGRDGCPAELKASAQAFDAKRLAEAGQNPDLASIESDLAGTQPPEQAQPTAANDNTPAEREAEPAKQAPAATASGDELF